MEDKDFYYEEEDGITFGEFLGVLFGRKLLLLIVTLSVFIVSAAGILFYNSRKQTYVGMFEYNVAGLSGKDGKYVDGSRFDVRDLITLEKLNQYKAEHEELSSLNMSTIYYKGAIKTLEWKEVYKKNDAKMTEDDNDFVLDKEGYQIVLKKTYFTKIQAQVLAQAIANEPSAISQSIVDNADYTQFLSLYSNSRIFDLRIDYLEDQYNLLYDKYTNMIEQYGDVVLTNGMKLSDVRLALQEYFQNYSFDSYRNELNYKGYVKDYAEYEQTLNSDIEALKLEKKYAEIKKNELINQRTELVQAATMYSVELNAYNDAIIKLTTRIVDIDNELEVLNKKLDNVDRVNINSEDYDATYVASLEAFDEALNKLYKELIDATNEYTTNEKEVVKKYSLVYFDNNSFVEKVNGIQIVLLLAIALFASFFIALIINLCVDGKKLTAEYRVNKKAQL